VGSASGRAGPRRRRGRREVARKRLLLRRRYGQGVDVGSPAVARLFQSFRIAVIGHSSEGEGGRCPPGVGVLVRRAGEALEVAGAAVDFGLVPADPAGAAASGMGRAHRASVVSLPRQRGRSGFRRACNVRGEEPLALTE